MTSTCSQGKKAARRSRLVRFARLARLMRSVLLAACVTLGACEQDPSEAFIGDRDLSACLDQLSVCAGVSADCGLDAHSYIRRVLPGQSPVRFMVPAKGNVSIRLTLFFEQQVDAGTYLQVAWHEPGCTEVHIDTVPGAAVYEDAKDDQMWSGRHRFEVEGDHLIEIDTDVRATVLIRVDLEAP